MRPDGGDARKVVKLLARVPRTKASAQRMPDLACLYKYCLDTFPTVPALTLHLAKAARATAGRRA